jgi:hypothetical protein
MTKPDFVLNPLEVPPLAVAVLAEDLDRLRNKQNAAEEMYAALTELLDSLRLRQGSQLITVNHDELMDLIPKGRLALALAEGNK